MVEFLKGLQSVAWQTKFCSEFLFQDFKVKVYEQLA
jgi:hypothetical protein